MLNECEKCERTAWCTVEFGSKHCISASGSNVLLCAKKEAALKTLLKICNKEQDNQL